MKKLLIALLIAGLAVPAFGAERIKIRKFAGLATRLSEYEIKDNESPDMVNFTLNEAGTLTKRNIFQKYNDTAVTNTSFTELYKFYTSSDAGYLIAAGGTTLYSATANELTSILTATTVVKDSEWGFETFTDGDNELVFAVNNGVALQSWNGQDENFIQEQSAPAENCNMVKKHKARLFASGSSEYPYRVYYSSLSDGDDWVTTGGTIDLPSYEKIMGLEVLSDVLYIFTRNRIYGLFGDTPNEFWLRPTLSNVGTHATNSIVLGNRLIIFLNKAGVFAFDGTSSTNLSEIITPTIDNISPTYLDKATALFDRRGRFWLSYTSLNGTFNDTILIYDTDVKQWYFLSNANFSSLLKADGGTDKGQLYGGVSDGSGFVWQLQEDVGYEQIVQGNASQLSTGTTFNTVVWDINDDAEVRLLGGPFGNPGDYASTDPNTKLLLHMDGEDGGLSVDDSSLYDHPMNRVGNGAYDDGEKVFGTTSYEQDTPIGANYIAGPADPELRFDAEDFTIESWVRFNTLPTDTANGYYLAMSWAVAIGTDCWSVELGPNGELDYNQEGLGDFNCTFTFDVDRWYHLAFVRDYANDNNYIFVDGVSQTLSLDETVSDQNRTGQLFIANYRDAGFSWLWPLDGWIDELRISKGIARYTSNFDPHTQVTSGTYTSENFAINATGNTSIGDISWNETLPTSSQDIQFTTRTGATDATVDFDGWETWVSSSVVTVNMVTDATAWMVYDSTYFSAVTPRDAQPRDVLSYETYDTVSADCVEFAVSDGTVSTNDFAWTTIPAANLTDTKFIGFWLKSDITGEVVKLSMGETTPTVVSYITPSTAEVSEWEYHYWPISEYSSTDIDNITFMEFEFIGSYTIPGSIYLGNVDAYDFLDNGEDISSTPDNYLQYRAILGTTVSGITPKLVSANDYIIKIDFAATLGEEETDISTLWKSKVWDMGNEYYKHFNWVELTAYTENPTTGNTVTLTADFDDTDRDIALEKTFDVTSERVKLRYYFPSGSYGKEVQLTVTDDTVGSALKIYNLTASYHQESGD